MKLTRSVGISEGSAPSEWKIHRELTGELSHDCVLGMDASLKVKDVFGLSSSQGYSKHCKEDHAREPKALIIDNTCFKVTVRIM